jgi:signal transduction histidine kinase
LRTPLTLLLSPLEALLQRFAGQADTGVHELLLTMHSNGMRLLKLINDLLDLIRLEAGRMEIKSVPMEVADFIKGLASAARQVAEDKKIKLETYTDLRLGVVAADPDKLEKIVLNLLFNALKFTPSGGRVELRAEKQGEEIVFVVNDTGIGIAAKNLLFVFDRFWQADSSAQRKYQGVGIGLALVKELTEMMHGQVTVESQEGKGTTFTVRLPYYKAEPILKTPPGTKTESGATASEEWLANLYRRAELFPAMVSLRGAAKPVELGKRGQRPVVLVADDEPDMRRFLRSQLDTDYDVLEAADGLQAAEKAMQFLPDIILLDMMMPEMDGLAVCRELRKHEETAVVPIILLTARADEETKFNALELGANDFLAKPFSSTELHARIKNLIESHDFQRNLSQKNRVLSNTIDQLKETESQLVQSEKLASLGRMSAGIIHEINNPLNFATTGLFALRNKCKQLEPGARREYEEILSDIEEGMKRVRNIVSDLRMFTHPEAGPSEPVDVVDAVNTSLRFLAGEWKDKVRVELKIVPGQTVQANRNKLIHVLVNLLQNSLDAMRQKKFENETPAIMLHGRVEGDRSLILVRDNGPGIERKHLDKIFDPFFTTKDVGEGMGLGLSICHRIVKGFDGHISVDTELGRFCEFTLDFPAKAKSEAEPEIEHGEPVRL